MTASATYHRSLDEGGFWATTVGWGRNAEPDHPSTNALLIESSVMVHGRDAVFGRFEVAQKDAHDLVVPIFDLATTAKLQGGYTRYLGTWAGLTPGIGAAASVGIVPGELRPFYGSRANAGAAVYVTLRPAAHGM